MKVFYSWQKDRPSKTNWGFIQDALEMAAQLLGSDPDLDVEPVIDRDTAGRSGSPAIAETIFEKIRASDAFVCDVSSAGESVRGKLTPNPNVLTELGYAVGVLGWERVIMVANTAFGVVEDLPFDLRDRRICPYSSAADDATRSASKKGLAAKLGEALRTIASLEREGALPPTVRELVDKAGDIRRDRDVSALRDAFRCLPDAVLSHHFQSAECGWFNSDDLWFYEGFNGLVQCASFDFYDGGVKEHVEAFHRAWSSMMSFPHLFSHDGHKTQFSVGQAGQRDFAWAAKQREAWDERVAAALDAYRRLVAYTREHYPEVDLDALARVGVQEFREHEQRFRQLRTEDEDRT